MEKGIRVTNKVTTQLLNGVLFISVFSLATAAETSSFNLPSLTRFASSSLAAQRRRLPSPDQIGGETPHLQTKSAANSTSFTDSLRLLASSHRSFSSIIKTTTMMPL
ncbi:unnamed protein product [Vicia faba]|uniref:Uncharacterized protein n=1 Tax=Vicia faba TaxID=3906 RepID=A0AAV0ZAH3_VICFA|nr:unnamed protein product [Vicia faba]